MRKKIKLRVELAIIMLVSLFISFFIAFVIRNVGLAYWPQNQQKREEMLYHDCLTQLESRLMELDLGNQSECSQLFTQQYDLVVGYEFYIVDEMGNVLAGSNEGITTVSSEKITDHYRDYTVSNKDKNVFRLNGCDYLKDNYYLYYTFLKYDSSDTGMVAGALAGAILCFFLLIWGRISYISSIRKVVGKITKGNLGARITYRYHNVGNCETRIARSQS